MPKRNRQWKGYVQMGVKPLGIPNGNTAALNIALHTPVDIKMRNVLCPSGLGVEDSDINIQSKHLRADG